MTVSASNPTPKVTNKERTQLDDWFAEPKFVKAYRRYDRTNQDYHIPYLAGSSKDGRTVYFDHRVPNSTKPFIAEHEKVEGVLIRVYGLPYDEAHKYATEAERSMVESTKELNWRIYQARLEMPIKEAAKAPHKNLPPDLLDAAYSTHGDDWNSM
jgi:hypothetical protein